MGGVFLDPVSVCSSMAEQVLPWRERVSFVPMEITYMDTEDKYKYMVSKIHIFKVHIFKLRILYLEIIKIHIFKSIFRFSNFFLGLA